jgi:hypothetical protein
MAVVKAGGHGLASLRGYIISPVANPVSLIREYASTYANELAKDLGVTVEICYWDKNEGTYSADWLAKSNFVVFLPTNNKFEAEIETRAMISEIETFSEIETATTMGLPIYLGYRSSGGILAYETKLYRSRNVGNYGSRFQITERPGYQINGISGTSNRLLSHCETLRKKTHEKAFFEKLDVTFSHHVVDSTKRLEFASASPSTEKTFKIGDWSYDERLLLLLL